MNLLQGPLNRCSALNAVVIPEFEDKCLNICTGQKLSVSLLRLSDRITVSLF